MEPFFFRRKGRRALIVCLKEWAEALEEEAQSPEGQFSKVLLARERLGVIKEVIEELNHPSFEKLLAYRRNARQSQRSLQKAYEELQRLALKCGVIKPWPRPE